MGGAVQLLARLGAQEKYAVALPHALALGPGGRRAWLHAQPTAAVARAELDPQAVGLEVGEHALAMEAARGGCDNPVGLRLGMAAAQAAQAAAAAETVAATAKESEAEAAKASTKATKARQKVESLKAAGADREAVAEARKAADDSAMKAAGRGRLPERVLFATPVNNLFFANASGISPNSSRASKSAPRLMRSLQNSARSQKQA